VVLDARRRIAAGSVNIENICTYADLNTAAGWKLEEKNDKNMCERSG
jgi:hypothetical protein